VTTAQRIFDISSLIRYVAIYQGGQLASLQRGNLSGMSSGESDRYEELLVNPTLLKLVQQRGNIDCGGARFVVVRYGNFYQLVIALPDGHVSVCFELTANPLEYADSIDQIVSAIRGS
jgi:hypothetical protein